MTEVDQTPFVTTYKLRFAADQLVVESEENVGAADTRKATFTGMVDPTAAARARQADR